MLPSWFWWGQRQGEQRRGKQQQQQVNAALPSASAVLAFVWTAHPEPAQAGCSGATSFVRWGVVLWKQNLECSTEKGSAKPLHRVKQQNCHRQKATQCNKAKKWCLFVNILWCFHSPGVQGCRWSCVAAACREHGGAVAAAVAERAASSTVSSPALFSCWHSWWHLLLCSHSFFQLL